MSNNQEEKTAVNKTANLFKFSALLYQDKFCFIMSLNEKNVFLLASFLLSADNLCKQLGPGSGLTKA